MDGEFWFGDVSGIRSALDLLFKIIKFGSSTSVVIIDWWFINHPRSSWIRINVRPSNFQITWRKNPRQNIARRPQLESTKLNSVQLSLDRHDTWKALSWWTGQPQAWPDSSKLRPFQTLLEAHAKPHSLHSSYENDTSIRKENRMKIVFAVLYHFSITSEIHDSQWFSFHGYNAHIYHQASTQQILSSRSYINDSRGRTGDTWMPCKCAAVWLPFNHALAVCYPKVSMVSVHKGRCNQLSKVLLGYHGWAWGGGAGRLAFAGFKDIEGRLWARHKTS